jgi:hypothetical protein
MIRVVITLVIEGDSISAYLLAYHQTILIAIVDGNQFIIWQWLATGA